MTDDLNRQGAKDSKGSLPDGWRWVRLGDVTELLPSKSVATDGDAEVKAITTACLTEHGFAPSGVKRARMWAEDAIECVVSRGEILIARSNTPELVGRVAMYSGEPCGAVATDLTIRIWPIADVVSEFLTAYLSFLYQTGYWKERAGGASGSMKKITRSQIGDEMIPLPPSAVQRRIASILNEQIAAVEKARAAGEARLEAAKALFAAYLQAVFADAEVKSWPKRRFDQVAVLQRGYDLPFQDRVPGPYPVITSSGQAGNHVEFKAIGPGVVTGRSGSVGRVHFVEEDYWPHNTALFVRDFLGNEPRYVFYLLQWINLRRVSSGTGVPTLDRKQVHKIIVPHPSVLDQKRIAAVLNMQIAAVEKLRAGLEAQLAEINALPAALLRRAFSGAL